MDSLSQFLLGAAIGQVFFEKNSGLKGFLLGGAFATVPDLDVFLNHSDDFVEQLKIHRGFSHSLIFCFLIPFLAALARPLLGLKRFSYWKSYLFFFLVFSTHVFLDILTSWGTQIFWPLPHRVSLDSLFIIDPLLTLPLFIGCLLQLFFSKKTYVYSGLFLCFFYCLFAISAHSYTTHLFKDVFAQKDIHIEKILVRPTPFNTLFWSATVLSEDKLFTGHARIWDTKHEVTFSKGLPRNSQRLSAFQDLKGADYLLRLTRGFYVLDRDDFIIRDARFDNLGSWSYPNNPIFVFNYHYSAQNQHWHQNRPHIQNIKELFSSLFQRIFS